MYEVSHTGRKALRVVFLPGNLHPCSPKGFDKLPGTHSSCRPGTPAPASPLPTAPGTAHGVGLCTPVFCRSLACDGRSRDVSRTLPNPKGPSAF